MKTQSLQGEQLVAYSAEPLPKLGVMDLRCSGVDDTDIASAIMALGRRERTRLVPERAVADAGNRVRA